MTMQIESTISMGATRPGAIALPTIPQALTAPRAGLPFDGEEWTPPSLSQKASVAEVSIHPDVTPPPKLLKPFGIEMWSGREQSNRGDLPAFA